jgi:hypothetical protein
MGNSTGPIANCDDIAKSYQASYFTRQKVLELTANTRNIMSMIFSYISTGLVLKDFQALADKTKCNKYVIFMANELNKYFTKVKITPVEDKSGVISFWSTAQIGPDLDYIAYSSLDELEKQFNPKKLSDNQQSLCLKIAYFYIRIFQIYGALALTLIDDMSVITGTDITTSVAGQPVNTSSFRQQPGAVYKPVQQGGSITTEDFKKTPLAKYKFIQTMLENANATTLGYKLELVGLGPNAFVKLSNTDDTKIVFTIGVKDGREAYLSLKDATNPLHNYSTFTFVEFGSKKSGVNYPDEVTELVRKNIISSKTITVQVAGDSFIIDKKDANEYVKNLINGISAYFESKREEKEISTNSKDIPEGLLSNKIKLAIDTHKPIAHCITRALQLLRTAPSHLPGESFICRFDFIKYPNRSGKLGQEYRSTGVIGYGKDSDSSQEVFDKSSGLFALGQLFYDTVGTMSPFIKRTDSAFQEYKAFMAKMGKLFTGKNLSIEPDKDISLFNQRDEKVCKALKKDGEVITVSSQTSYQVYGVVQELFKRQAEHAAKCCLLFHQLFDLSKIRSYPPMISLHPNLLRGGLPEIERVNREARNLLVQYYVDCENKYLKGVKMVFEGDASVPPTPSGRHSVPLTPSTGASVAKGSILKAPVAKAPDAKGSILKAPVAPIPKVRLTRPTTERIAKGMAEHDKRLKEIQSQFNPSK